MRHGRRKALAALVVSGALIGGGAALAHAATSASPTATPTPTATPSASPGGSPAPDRRHPCPNMSGGSRSSGNGSV